MPDPALYFLAMAAAAGVSTFCVLALGRPRPPASAARRNAACVLALAVALVLGYAILQLRPAWPPANALDRLLTIVLPAVVAVELLAGLRRVPGSLAWFLRSSLSLAVGRILLHGSVYLDDSRSEWTAGQAPLAIASCGLLLVVVWGLLARLSQRSSSASIPLALSLSILSGGAAIMLAGYLAGGKAAFPPAGALVGIAMASSLAARRSGEPGAVGVGVVALFGLLFIGRFFGGLSTERALAVLLAPLLCWGTQLPPLRGRPWLAAALCLALVMLWLGLVLAGAKCEFDREMGPLLGLAAGGGPLPLAS